MADSTKCFNEIINNNDKEYFIQFYKNNCDLKRRLGFKSCIALIDKGWHIDVDFIYELETSHDRNQLMSELIYRKNEELAIKCLNTGEYNPFIMKFLTYDVTIYLKAKCLGFKNFCEVAKSIYQ